MRVRESHFILVAQRTRRFTPYLRAIISNAFQRITFPEHWRPNIGGRGLWTADSLRTSDCRSRFGPLEILLDRNRTHASRRPLRAGTSRSPMTTFARRLCRFQLASHTRVHGRRSPCASEAIWHSGGCRVQPMAIPRVTGPSAVVSCSTRAPRASRTFSHHTWFPRLVCLARRALSWR